MTTTQLVPRMYLKFDGADASEEVMDSVISIEVDDSLTLPDMFSIHLRDTNLKWIDDDTFSPGKSVDISAKNGGAEVKLITGEITGIEPRLDQTAGPTLILRGFDKSHRLSRGKKTTSFVQMTDSDIAKKIAQNSGFKTKIDSTREVHEYVLQDNKTDWEFLVSRSQRIGYRVLVKDDTLHFVQIPDANEDTPTVEWAEDLTEFNARLSTMRQVSEVIVQGWDPGKKQQIVGQATQSNDTPQIGEGQQGSQTTQQAFSLSTKEIIVNRPVSTQAEADAMAQSICDEIGQGFIEAECIALGNPAIQAGVMVKLEGLGDRFSGTYRTTHAMHRYDPAGYFTEFTIGGRHATTINELLSTKKNNHSHSPTLGVVTNNDDPKKLGRIKVNMPTLSNSQESTWARLVTPGAGENKGLAWIPDVGDEVLVLFEHEDVNYPLVIGGLWSEDAGPADSSNLVDSGKGTTMRIDTHEKMGLIIMDKPDDTSLQIGDQDNHISISKTDAKAIIKSSNEINLEGVNISIDADANINLKSSANIKIEAGGVVEIKGSVIQLN